MAGKNTAVFGIYPTQASVELGVDALKADGFRNTDISVLFPENAGTKDFAHEKGTKAPEGASAGAGTGAVVGGALGWLVGIGALAIPGVGPFIAESGNRATGVVHVEKPLRHDPFRLRDERANERRSSARGPEPREERSPSYRKTSRFLHEIPHRSGGVRRRPGGRVRWGIRAKRKGTTRDGAMRREKRLTG